MRQRPKPRRCWSSRYIFVIPPPPSRPPALLKPALPIRPTLPRPAQTRPEDLHTRSISQVLSETARSSIPRVRTALRHRPASMYFNMYFSPGLPLCRASLIHTQKACGLDRPPCLCRLFEWASRIVGLPGCIQHGLRHGPASMYLNVYLSPGLPLCRASLMHTIWPPAYTGLPVYVDPVVFLPASSGFPVVFHMASCMDRLPCILQCILPPGLPLGRASHVHIMRPPA